MSINKIIKSLEIEKLLQVAQEDYIEDMVYDTMRKMEQNMSPEEYFFLPMRILDEYRSSEEYHKLQEVVRKDWERMGRTAQQYLGRKQELAEACEDRIVSQKYGKGGPGHRGPLHPGHMEIICRSGNRKGRLLKQSKAPDYIYGFDQEGRLLFCKSKMGKTIEYIIWEGNRELGVSYLPNGRVKAISEVSYASDGKLESYVYGTFSYRKHKVEISSSCECYEYHGREVYVDWIEASGKYPSCEHFRFYCDEEGVVEKGECCDVMRKEIMEVAIPRGIKFTKK